MFYITIVNQGVFIEADDIAESDRIKDQTV